MMMQNNPTIPSGLSIYGLNALGVETGKIKYRINTTSTNISGTCILLRKIDDFIQYRITGDFSTRLNENC